ncbi:MAG: hypothetical protein ACE5GM_10820 [bacterium]
MIIFKGFLLAAVSSGVITALVIGLSDLYVGRYGDGTTLIILAAVVSALMVRVSRKFLDEISRDRYGMKEKVSTSEQYERDILPPVIYDTSGFGLIILALLVGVGGPLSSGDYMGKFLNPAIGLFLIIAGGGILWLKGQS